MAVIHWKTFAEIEEERNRNEQSQPLTTEQQLANIIFNQTLSEMKLQQTEQNNANILLTLAKNGIM